MKIMEENQKTNTETAQEPARMLPSETQPVSENAGAFESATYFRIPFDRVRETADTAEVIKTITGSINPEKDDDNDIR